MLSEEIQMNSGVIEIGENVCTNIRLDDLKYMGDVGSGSFGGVSRRRLNNHLIAVKWLPITDDEEEVRRVNMDLDVIRRSNDCEYIVKFHGYLITYGNLYICMELMATCLERLIKRLNTGFPIAVIGKIAVSVIKGLNYLKEQHNIIHRDVKPSNILINYLGMIKLCDFGLSGQLINSQAYTMSIGCVAYLAPERISVRQPYDVRSDVWSFGLTLFYLTTGTFPYENDNLLALMIRICQDPPPILNNELFPLELCEFIRLCLQKDPNYRPRYRELSQQIFYREHVNNEFNVADWLANVWQV